MKPWRRYRCRQHHLRHPDGDAGHSRAHWHRDVCYWCGRLPCAHRLGVHSPPGISLNRSVTPVCRTTPILLSFLLFLLMGQFATHGELSAALLFPFVAAFMGHLRGGGVAWLPSVPAPVWRNLAARRWRRGDDGSGTLPELRKFGYSGRYQPARSLLAARWAS